MITPSFSLTATERVLPSMALDFTTASLDSRVTFTRTGNTATVVGSDGYIATINADLPRFDYDPVTLACKGLLIEESRINVILRSSEFDNASWSKTQTTVSADSTTSPDGTANADTIIESTAVADNFFIAQSVTKAASATTYTYSVMAKQNGRNIRLYADGNSNSNKALVDINLSTGELIGAASVAGTFTAASASVASLGNGWYRCILTYTSDTATTMRMRLFLLDGTSSIYTGDGTSGVYLYGAQLEAGAFPTSYIPTTTAAVTRNADVATMTGTNFSDWYNATEGTFACQFQTTWSGNAPLTSYILAGNSSATKRIIYIGSGGQVAGTYDGASIISALGNITGTSASVVSAYSAAGRAISGAGTTTQTGTIAAGYSTLTSLALGAIGTTCFGGWLKRLDYWPQRLTATEVQAFSK